MPLIHPSIIEKHTKNPAKVPSAHAEILNSWAKNLEKGIFNRETSHDGEFIQRILIDILGYTGSSAGQAWTVGKNQPVGTGNVDVALGQFTPTSAKIVAPFELKGAKTRDLDAIMPGRNKSPVQQAWEYAMDAKGAKWVLVSNYRKIRLYAVGYGRRDYEEFDLSGLSSPEKYARFTLLLSPQGLLGGGVDALLKESETRDKEITDNLYSDYKSLRSLMISELVRDNPAIPFLNVIQHTQTILDRILFVAFAEDRGLLPDDTLKECFEERAKWNPQPVWENFKGLFRSIDKGNPDLKIPGYNGGLFAENPELDALLVNDAVCEGFKAIGDYDFESDVSVNILGHIFEQSITDLEEIKSKIAGSALEANPKKSKRKKDGIFYTPSYITRHIVEQAVGSWLNDRKKEIGFHKLPTLSEEDFNSIQTISRGQRKGTVTYNAKIEKHVLAWEAYKKALSTIKVLDPACGSGAFLNEVFDFLFREGQLVNNELTTLNGGQEQLFRWDKHILANNIYGVDVNSESVEITKLSLWLKTANRNEKLTYLDDNIRCGNSLIDNPSVAPGQAFIWKDEFPEIMKAGGFHVVVGNPPWVSLSGKHGQRLPQPVLNWLIARYNGNTYMPNLFEYFVAKSLTLLNKNGYVCLITPDRLCHNVSFSNLRETLLRQTTLLEVIYKWDFPGVIVDTVTFLAKSTLSSSNVVQIYSRPGEDPVEVKQSELLKDKHYQIKAFTDDTSQALIEKILASSKPLGSYAKITSGFGGKSSEITTTRRNKRQIEAIRGSSVGRYMLNEKVFFDFRDENITGRTRDESKLGVKEKVLIRKTGGTIIATYDDSGVYPEQSAYFIYEIGNITFKVALAILNSNVATWFYRNYLVTNLDSTPQIKTFDLEKIPIPALSKPDATSLTAEVDTLLTKHAEKRELVLKFIELLRVDFELPKISRNIDKWYTLSFQDFVKELANRKVSLSLSQRAEWMQHFKTEKLKVEKVVTAITASETKIDQTIYAALKLNSAEIAAIEGANEEDDG